MKKVYITQENTNHNYTQAEQYGDIVFLTRSDFSTIKNSLSNKALIEELRSKLKNFDKDDYVIVSGSPTVACAAFMILREKTDSLNILKWSNRDHHYQHLVITV